MNWTVILVIVGWVVPAIAVAFITRSFERRPQLLSYFQGSGAVTLNDAHPPVTVHMHTVVIRNVGRQAAMNLRITHATLPAYSIFPPMQHHVDTLPSGQRQIVFPVFPPRSQVTINYVYFPPLLWSQIHVGVTSDDGSPRTVDMLTTPRLPNVIIGVIMSLIAVGIIALIYLLYLLGVYLSD